jgi:hypothetical protein
MSSKIFIAVTLTAGLLLSEVAVRAKDGDDAPKPAAAGGDDSAVVSSDGVPDTPDTRPVSGMQNVSLGSQSGSHSLVLPSFGVTSAVQMNPYQGTQSNTQSLTSTTYVSGRLGVNEISGHSELLFDYLAGGGFSNYSGQGSSLIQSLSVAETVHWGRWSQMFGDHLTYLPGSSFDFGGLGGLDNLGVNLGAVGSTPGFRQDLLPNDSIMTAGDTAVSNSAMVQTSYALGYRSSLTFGGAYGTLNFLRGGLQDSNSVSATAGYNYLLSPLNSISISYGFGRMTLSGVPQRFDNHAVQLSFARRLTGKMSFQVGAGPDVQLFDSTISGESRVVSWAAYSSMSYRIGRVASGLTYSHSLTGGSGVLPGAETDTVSGSLGRALGRWHASLSGGYSSNQALQQTTGNTHPVRLQGWFAGVSASRSFLRLGSFFISYNVAGQSSLAGVCALPVCGTNTFIQTASAGYNWGFRPIIVQ